jgi:hypothetical protein
LEVDTLETKCLELSSFYKNDINGEELFNEILDCRMLLKTRQCPKLSKPEDVLQFIVKYGDRSVFPNLRVAMQMMLTIAISIASCERSFSKLKLILTYLRASMGQGRLADLALLSVERKVTEQTNFDDLIDMFARAKARRKEF